MKKSYLTFDLDFIMFLVVSPIFRLENATAKNEEPLTVAPIFVTGVTIGSIPTIAAKMNMIG